MAIAIITIPSEATRAFANSLHKISGEKVELVIIQKRKPEHRSIWQRVLRLYRSAGIKGLPHELLYAILVRVDIRVKRALKYFRERSGRIPDDSKDYLPKVLITESVNSDEVHEALSRISPKLLVVWGSAILAPRIISTAEKAINLHMGLCPYYRGAIANQHAVMRGHMHRIGATIHYLGEKVDTGDIIETIVADISRPPRELFRDLNDKAEARFLEISSRLYAGEHIPGLPQDLSIGESMRLKQWTPKTRYNLARQIINWERAGKL